MKYIYVLDILLEYIFMFAFAVFLVLGVFNWRFFIAAGAALVLYVIWALARLRCPWCHSGVELGELARARRHGCHCPACGHEITVVTRVNKNPRGRRGE